VYNPYAINWAFTSTSPGNYEFKWLESGHSRVLINLLMQSRATGSALEERNVNISVLTSVEPHKIEHVALMLYAGYLTIRAYNRETGMLTVGPPNASIKEHLLGVIAETLTFKTGKMPHLYRQLARQLVQAMFNASIGGVEAYLSSIVAIYPHQMWKKDVRAKDIAKAKGLQSTYNVMFSTWLEFGTRGNQFVDRESSKSEGDIDLVMIDSRTLTVCLVEFKVGHSAEKALRQIREKNFRARYPAYKAILVGINITEKRRVEVAMEVEKPTME
jgi:Holliday junction resolvase-like predicted endonuclease